MPLRYVKQLVSLLARIFFCVLWPNFFLCAKCARFASVCSLVSVTNDYARARLWLGVPHVPARSTPNEELLPTINLRHRAARTGGRKVQKCASSTIKEFFGTPEISPGIRFQSSTKSLIQSRLKRTAFIPQSRSRGRNATVKSPVEPDYETSLGKFLTRQFIGKTRLVSQSLSSGQQESCTGELRCRKMELMPN